MSKEKWTEHELAVLRRSVSQGYSTTDIALTLNRSKHAVRAMLQRLRLQPIDPKDQHIIDLQLDNAALSADRCNLRADLQRQKEQLANVQIMLSEEVEAHGKTVWAKDRMASDLRDAKDHRDLLQHALEEHKATAARSGRITLAVVIGLAVLAVAIAWSQGWRAGKVQGRDEGLGTAISEHSQIEDLLQIPVDPATGLQLARFDTEAATDAPKAQ